MVSLAHVAFGNAREGRQHIRAEDVALAGQFRFRVLIEIGDPPIWIYDEQAVGRALEYGSHTICRLLGLFLGAQQLALTVLQGFSHDVERVPDTRDLGFCVADVQPAGIVAKPPAVRCIAQVGDERNGGRRTT